MKCDKKTMLLYAVTDRAWTGRQSLYEQVEAALKGGATCIQLREKDLNGKDFLREAMEISALCKEYQVPFLINDNVEIAIQCHADGVHVGQEDMEAFKVRQRVGKDMIIGVSVHSVEEALEAVRNGADYLGVVKRIYPSFPVQALTVSLWSVRFLQQRILQGNVVCFANYQKKW